MDWLLFHFPVSGVTTNIFFPPLLAFVISAVTSTAGVSGAFLLLPLQMSLFNFTSPSVSGTNHVFNVVAIPGGVYRYYREGRMFWPLSAIIIAGTVPGVFLGYFVRVWWLPDPAAFKFFVGCVLMVLGIKLSLDVFGPNKGPGPDSKFKSVLPVHAVVETRSFSLEKVEYQFWGERFSFSTPAMFLLALVVGIVGGAYGIGGGAIIAPFCAAFFRLPVYTIAGSTLLGTFTTSVVGSVFFSLMPGSGGVSSRPDWLLGVAFGLGGFAGVYAGARLQKHLPQRIIKAILAGLVVFLAAGYIRQFIF